MQDSICHSASMGGSAPERDSGRLVGRRLILIWSGIGLLTAPFAILFIKRRASARSITIVLDGPFPLGIPIRREPSKADFVQLMSVQMEQKRKDAIVAVDFLYQGEEERRRHIELRVILEDKSRTVIGSQEVRTTDARIHGGRVIQAPSAFMFTSENNRIGFRIGNCDLNNVAKIRLTFSERHFFGDL